MNVWPLYASSIKQGEAGGRAESAVQDAESLNCLHETGWASCRKYNSRDTTKEQMSARALATKRVANEGKRFVKK